MEIRALEDLQASGSLTSPTDERGKEIGYFYGRSSTRFCFPCYDSRA
jgi:hypothetical protein